MSVDGKLRAYKFRVSIAGIPVLDCNKITGLDVERGVITHNDAQGNEVPLTGVRKIAHLEFHDWDPTSAVAFFKWLKSDDPEPKAGTIIMYYQDKKPGMLWAFYDAIPEGVSGDDADRGTEDRWGTSLKMACTISSVKKL